MRHPASKNQMLKERMRLKLRELGIFARFTRKMLGGSAAGKIQKHPTRRSYPGCPALWWHKDQRMGSFMFNNLNGLW
jgi:hypothetical protein